MHSRLVLNLLCSQSFLYTCHSVSTTGGRITGMCHHTWHCCPKVFIVYWNYLYLFVYLVTQSALQNERFSSSNGYTPIFWNLSIFSVHTSTCQFKEPLLWKPQESRITWHTSGPRTWWHRWEPMAHQPGSVNEAHCSIANIPLRLCFSCVFRPMQQNDVVFCQTLCRHISKNTQSLLPWLRKHAKSLVRI